MEPSTGVISRWDAACGGTEENRKSGEDHDNDRAVARCA
jgi:hypothetical protein